MLHAEFSAMDYTLNIVSKCCSVFIFKHSRAPKRSWKIFHGVLESPGKVLDFFVSKRVRTLSYTVDVSVSVNNVRTIGCILMNF